MTQPTPEDLTDTDGLVQRTDNGPTPDDPGDDVSQDPNALPEGTETGEGA